LDEPWLRQAVVVEITVMMGMLLGGRIVGGIDPGGAEAGPLTRWNAGGGTPAVSVARF